MFLMILNYLKPLEILMKKSRGYFGDGCKQA
ncbi:hypothetical protein JBW_00243 [Pelosinus fermentans JBW45]|uniref:Uncharacterized protein n=1 Tax=Pelosinus fermentans JBW45 TaxID=1192197 RepID=I9D9S8_9FIRM|nr:hypothetical protein JBW_00243 [Pelosinus fermentans JBW45]